MTKMRQVEKHDEDPRDNHYPGKPGCIRSICGFLAGSGVVDRHNDVIEAAQMSRSVFDCLPCMSTVGGSSGL